jgi:hypothetical protein
MNGKIEAVMCVMGLSFNVQVFGSDNGKYYALTRFSDSDKMIIDGSSVEEVLELHRFSLPLAVSCRRRYAPVAPL